MDREELAWAAGFFDGEGCTCLTKRDDRKTFYRQLQVVVKQTVDEPGDEVWDIPPWTLERFQKAVQVGTISGPFRGSRQFKNAKAHYQWQVTNFEGAQYVIALLWHWLSPVKKEQALKCLRAKRASLDRPPRTRDARTGRFLPDNLG